MTEFSNDSSSINSNFSDGNTPPSAQSTCIDESNKAAADISTKNNSIVNSRSTVNGENISGSGEYILCHLRSHVTII